MRIPRIYHPEPLAIDTVVALTAEAATHVARVLRLRLGAGVILFNGKGGEFQATLESIERRCVTARIGAYVGRDVESPLEIVLAQGISRGERMDYVVQKAVELGVASIVPVVTDFCSVKLTQERLDKRQQHWQAIALSACEQSGRNRVPDCLAPVPLSIWLEGLENQDPALRLVLDRDADLSIKSLTLPPRKVVLLIGPEGGLSDSEIQLALKAGFMPLSLGPRVMRTETAAAAALACLQMLWGDFA